MSQKPETRFRKQKVIPFLRTLKNTWFEPIQQLCIQGSPDFLLCVHGLFVALELKSDKGKVSPLQRKKLQGIEKAQGIAIVATPATWKEIKERLYFLDGGINGKVEL